MEFDLGRGSFYKLLISEMLQITVSEFCWHDVTGIYQNQPLCVVGVDIGDFFLSSN